MGAKTAAKEKRDTTCDVCSVKFLTIQALRSHESAKHSEKKREATPKNTLVAPVSRVSKRLQLKKEEETTEMEAKNTVKDEVEDKTLFPCPSCDKTFTTSFQASKHMEKKHGAASDGDSAQTIDAIDICNICDKPMVEPHGCVQSPKGTLEVYVCLSCDEEFVSIASFGRHALAKHQHDVDSMFFKTQEEFTSWKINMETQVKIKYLVLNKTQIAQKYYQCMFVSPRNELNKTYLCPSMVAVKEVNMGFQIHYNKMHFGHVCPKYQLPIEFTRNLTNRRDEKKDEKLIKAVEIERNELMHTLKMLFKNTTMVAAKLNVSQLKKFLDKALELKAFLNSCSNDNDPIVNKNMTDDQITNALEVDPKRTSVRLKRKFNDAKVKSEVNDAKVKSEVNDVVKTENSEQIFKENLESSRSSRSLLQSPSFVDSYKEFVEKQPKPLTPIDIKKPVKPVKNVVKTKMGQFTPKSPDEPTAKKTKPNVLRPSKINMGVKDFKYEVREQENGCNILILKI